MKPLVLIQGPVATRSGYGNHTRDLALALIKSDKYEVHIASMPWGSCPMNALEEDNEDHSLLFNRIMTTPLPRQPDIFIQISVPNEFQKVGKYNIGITAGIETTACSAPFLEGFNRMDFIITTSQHSKAVFLSSVYDKVNEQTNQKVGELRADVPMDVLFEGVDTSIYYKTNKLHETVVDELSQIKEKFCFLFVGHWLQGNLGQDRKDIGMLVKTMHETFKNNPSTTRPALVLKTSGATFSIIDREQILKKLRELAKPYGNKAVNVYLLHGDLTDSEMNSLYNHPKMKALVSFTKGEGFGRPLLEFTTSGKPVIASNWSGQRDFLHPNYSTLLPGKLTDIDKSAMQKDMLIQGSQWFTVEYAYASNVFKDVFKNYKQYIAKAKKQLKYTLDNFTLEQMNVKFLDMIENGAASIPKPMALNLPKLKRVDKKPATSQLKLPKLKKMTT